LFDPDGLGADERDIFLKKPVDLNACGNLGLMNEAKEGGVKIT
jgi:hypothetical protein